MFENPLIIFDCDGVLIDSEAIYLSEEFTFLEARGIHVDKAAYVGEFMALAQPIWRAKFSNLVEKHTGNAITQAEYDAMKLSVRTRILNEVKVVSGVEAMLDKLNSPTCVASSTSMKWLPGKLERTKLAPYFGAHVYSGDHVENGKPAPDLFLHAAAKTGGLPENSIVIEDSANGVRGGKAAGMFTLGFTGGSHCFDGHDQTLLSAGADLVISSHADLADWLRKNTGAMA